MPLSIPEVGTSKTGLGEEGESKSAAGNGGGETRFEQVAR